MGHLGVGARAPGPVFPRSRQAQVEGCFQEPLIPWAPPACFMDVQREGSGGWGDCCRDRWCWRQGLGRVGAGAALGSRLSGLWDGWAGTVLSFTHSVSPLLTETGAGVALSTAGAPLCV